MVKSKTDNTHQHLSTDLYTVPSFDYVSLGGVPGVGDAVSGMSTPFTTSDRPSTRSASASGAVSSISADWVTTTVRGLFSSCATPACSASIWMRIQRQSG